MSKRRLAEEAAVLFLSWTAGILIWLAGLPLWAGALIAVLAGIGIGFYRWERLR